MFKIPTLYLIILIETCQILGTLMKKILYFTTENFTLLQKTLLHEKYFFYKPWADLNSF